MNATTIIILSVILTPCLCYVAYRCGYGWNTAKVMDPFTVTTFGQRNPALRSEPCIDLRPGGITAYDVSEIKVTGNIITRAGIDVSVR